MCVCVGVCVVVVLAAVVMVVITFGICCFGGLGRRSGDDDGHGDGAPACVGGAFRAVSAVDVRLDAVCALSCFRTLASLAGVLRMF